MSDFVSYRNSDSHCFILYKHYTVHLNKSQYVLRLKSEINCSKVFFALVRAMYCRPRGAKPNNPLFDVVRSCRQAKAWDLPDE